MIGLSDSSKINGAPGKNLVQLELFCACKVSSYLRSMTILDDDVVRMCPSDLIGCYNSGTKGVRLVHIVPG